MKGSSKKREPGSGKGHLYLIPTPLGPDKENKVLPAHVCSIIYGLDTFIVEQVKKAVSFLRWIKHPIPDYQCRFYELNKNTPDEDLPDMLTLLKKGNRCGLLSNAGCPAVADPGARLIAMAHQAEIPVIPLVGPSSILLAMMASGLNGQSFSFHGYLPRPGTRRTQIIRQLEQESREKKQTQIFMETPFRNNDLMKELASVLSPQTRLCTATNLTLPDETIQTFTIQQWRKKMKMPGNNPTIFLLLA